MEQAMALSIRDVQPHEMDSVLALNNAAGSTILPLDAAALRTLYAEASYFRLAEVDGHIAGFLPALREHADYTSPNFQWFRAHYPEFVYIDRIVVAKPYRGLGLGRVFYSDVTSYAETRVPLLACEVFLEPRDDVSLLFHGTYGFQEVGQQTMPNNGRRVALLAKTLCSYPFVRDTYLHQTGASLPDLPWLAEREHFDATPRGARVAGGA
jgi:predicted GNAT superfamily acetyltransferase